LKDSGVHVLDLYSEERISVSRDITSRVPLHMAQMCVTDVYS